MRLQLRFTLVFITIFLVASSYLLLEQKFEIDRSNKVLSSELKQREGYFESIVSLEGRSLQAFDEDYSFWDDMVNFIKNNNVAFAHENLDTGLSTFNADTDWVYKPNGKFLYFSAANGSNTLQTLNLPPQFFTKLSTSKFLHFYIYDTNQLIEIRASTVVPSNDPNHATQEQGFLLIGRILNKGYTKSISNLSTSSVTIAPSMEATNMITGSTVSFSEPLDDWDGQGIAVLRSSSTLSVVQDLKSQSIRQLELVAVLIFFSVCLIITLLWWLVLRPLALINRAIKLQNPPLLDSLRVQRTEFGRLADTVSEFFHQKVSLAEAEFKRTELEKLNKEKSSFLAVAAHELNGPVTNVKMFADYLSFLLKNPAHHNEAEVQKQLHAIEHQSNKINMLLKDLRAASQGQQQLEFKMHDFDFDAFLKEEIDEAAISIEKQLNLQCETHVTIYSDPDRLGQVVTNLIRNATKYSPDSNIINIRGELKHDQVLVSVQDFGLGITADDLPHLFERFYRSGKVSSSIPGLGLGLYISKSIVERLGGTIWAESVYGKGSTFYFSVPLSHKDKTSGDTSNPLKH